MKVLKKGDYSGLFLGNVPMDTVIQGLLDILGEKFGPEASVFEPKLCETIDRWMESGQEDIEGLANNIKSIIEVTGKVANNILWYLIGIEYEEGRAVCQSAQ